MELTKNTWNRQDIKQYSDYLKSLSGTEIQRCFEKRITNTTLDCLAIKANVIKDIVKQISKGNILEFLDFWQTHNLAEMYVFGKLINTQSDFDVIKKYLTKYANQCECWATCDIIKPKITKNNKEQIYNMAIQYTKSEKTYVKRIGFRILFNYVDDKIDEILHIIDKFSDEKGYYVNMIIAWLLCECFIKQRDKTLEYYQCNSLNQFTINKSIQKCIESFRISNEDKQMLRTLKK